MKTLAAGAGFLLALLLANVVGAGVFAVLGPLTHELEDPAARISAMAILMVLSVTCAVLFLRGAIAAVHDLARWGGA